MAQTDYKKLIAYSSVSHMGYVMLGMAAFTEAGINGAGAQMFNPGTITAMLFILVGVIYDRAHTREINAFGGLASQMPVYAALTGFAFFAAMGFAGALGLHLRGPGADRRMAALPCDDGTRRRYRDSDRRLYAFGPSNASTSARSTKNTRACRTLRCAKLSRWCARDHRAHPRRLSARHTLTCSVPRSTMSTRSC